MRLMRLALIAATLLGIAMMVVAASWGMALVYQGDVAVFLFLLLLMGFLVVYGALAVLVGPFGPGSWE